ncbi:MAG: TonB-dependent receptor [Myxococcales bacterium]|nr:TonB-dependent receptor [Myxococcales bacterium]
MAPPRRHRRHTAPLLAAAALTALAAVIVLARGGDADADGGAAVSKTTGSVRGVVTFKGTPPERTPIDRSSDPHCAGNTAPSEDVVVTDGKLRDVLVRVANGSAGEHAAPTEPVVIHQHDCAYTPRVVGIVAGQKLQIVNGDPTFHNVRGNLGKRILFNLPQAAEAAPIERDVSGKAGDVVSLACDVHPWMHAWVAIQDHPFFTVTGADGAFELTGLAPGTYTIEAWHPTLGLQTTKVKVKKGGNGKKAAKATLTFSAPAE